MHEGANSVNARLGGGAGINQAWGLAGAAEGDGGNAFAAGGAGFQAFAGLIGPGALRRIFQV